jgi:drug/metabolite transporter (DMT)-like permease
MNSNSILSKGVVHMLFATFWFALMNVFVKKLTHLPTMELVFFRCSIATIIGFIGLQNKGVSWIGSNRKLLLLRGFFGTAALYTFFLTLQHLPLGTAVTIQYLSPIFTTIAAIFILKEKIKNAQWIYFTISFIGVLLIKGLNSKVSWEMLAIGILSAILSGLAYNMVRSLKEKEHPYVVVLHFQLIGALIGLGFTLFNWSTPIGIDWLYILLIGVLTQLGQVQLTKSLQSEKIGRVTIVNYLGIIYALLFGWIFFGEKHDWMEVMGMLIVIGGVILNLVLTDSNKDLKVTKPI